MPAVEQSFGMTTGTGDGTVGGYSSARVTSMFAGMLSRTNGVLIKTTKSPTVSGLSTTNLTVGTYACLNQGFYYEGSGIVLTMAGIGSGTYYLVNRVNNTASAVGVIRCEGTGATTTTIAARTVRTALITTANYSGTTDVILAAITVNSAAVITAIDEESREWTTNPTLPYTEYLDLGGTSSGSVANVTETLAASPGGASLQGVIRNSSGTYTFARGGLYLFTASMTWDTNTTGSRWMRFGRSAVYSTTIPSGATAASLVNPGTYLGLTANTVMQTYTWQGVVEFFGGSGGSYEYGLYLYQNSGTTRTYSYLTTTLTLLS
jgi:hypothetical protein